VGGFAFLCYRREGGVIIASNHSQFLKYLVITVNATGKDKEREHTSN